MWEWNPATRHHLRAEVGEWLCCRTSQWVCTSGQACRGARVWDGRVSATVVHNRVERGERRGERKRVQRNDVTDQTGQVNSKLWLCFLSSLCLCSQCSRSCGKGLQMREVRCLTQDKKHSHECDLSRKPEQEQICNTIPCSPQVAGWCVWWCTVSSCVSAILPTPTTLPPSLSLPFHRWKLPWQTSQLCDGGSGEAVRLLLLQERLLCLVYPKCSAC